MRLDYRIVNVFTREGGALTGNPLCVFEDGSSLDTPTMQALALQFNLSETSFVLPSDRADAKVRIFSPSYEMPFAGHPTLGTSHVVRDLLGLGEAVALELNVGVIPVRRDGRLWELRANTATTRVPAAAPEALAEALGIAESDLAGQPLWVSTGTEQLIVPVATPAAVARVSAPYERLKAATMDGPRPNAYVFAKAGEGRLVARYFFSRTGAMIEDPATGSATANLGGFLLANGGTPPLTFDIAQGEMAGRPSALRLRIDEARNVYVAGEVVELGRGFVDLADRRAS
jgi:trans-2,3-dihydro-3-hydroxyanthranilate isomerase